MDEERTAQRRSGDGDRAERVLREGRELRNELGAALASGERLLEETYDSIRENLERRPYAVLATAAGAGYVLGGGLPIRATRWVLDLATRTALAALVHELTRRTTTEET